MHSTSRTITRNIIFALLLQFVTLISGFVVPKIILLYFGSEVNGLVSSIIQFLSYITLLEGGLSGVIMAGLYKPLQKGDAKQISGVVNAANIFFKKIALIYLAYVLVISIVYPLKNNASFSYSYTFVLIWVLAANLFTQYYFSLTYKLLIQADQKAYIVSIVQTIVVLLNIAATVLIAMYYQSLLIIKLFGVLFYCIQPIVFRIYVHSHYSIDREMEADDESISQRWDGFWQNIAFFVHSNTDIVVLTFFSTLVNVSVYTVYLLVINALKNLIISISSSIIPTIGNILAKNDKKEIKSEFNHYEFVIFYVTTFLFAAGISLIVPFVSVYTHGINDANYYQPAFAVLMVLAEAVYCLRDPYVSITYAAGHFKQTRLYAMLEAIINILLSILLVYKYGLLGVAIGTLVAMSFRAITHVLYLKRNILNRPRHLGFTMLSLSCTIIIGIYYLTNHLLNTFVVSYYQWFVLAIEVSILTLSIITCISLLIYPSQMKYLTHIITNKFNHKQIGE